MNTTELDSLKLRYLESFIQDCKSNGTKIVLYMSPSYCSKAGYLCSYIESLASKHGVFFFNHLDDKDVYIEPSFFKDASHMNEKGAMFLTKKIIPELKQVLSE